METRGGAKIYGFEGYYEYAGWDIERKEFARIIWNAAIATATELVRENFDETEPWLTPEAMEELSA